MSGSVPDSVLEARALCIGHKAAVPIVEDVQVSIKAGQWLALIGGNGSGKSTLLHTLGGLLPPLAGEVLLQGQSLRRIQPAQRARHMAMLLTGMPLSTGMLVDEFLALGRFPHRDWMGSDPLGAARVDSVRRMLELQAFGPRPFNTLSDGERQRVLLGRALVQDAPLLLLDEPSHHLDPAQRARMQGVLKRWREAERDRAVLVATHDLAWAFAAADRIGVLAEGRLHWGSPGYWREHPARLHEAYGAQGLRLDAEHWRFEAG